MCIFRHVASVAVLGMWFLLAVYEHAPKKVSAEAGEHRFLSSIAMVPENHLRREKTPMSIYMSTDAITDLKLYFDIHFSCSDFPFCCIAARKSIQIHHCQLHMRFFLIIFAKPSNRDLDYGCDTSEKDCQTSLPAPLLLCQDVKAKVQEVADRLGITRAGTRLTQLLASTAVSSPLPPLNRSRAWMGLRLDRRLGFCSIGSRFFTRPWFEILRTLMIVIDNFCRSPPFRPTVQLFLIQYWPATLPTADYIEILTLENPTHSHELWMVVARPPSVNSIYYGYYSLSLFIPLAGILSSFEVRDTCKRRPIKRLPVKIPNRGRK